MRYKNRLLTIILLMALMLMVTSQIVFAETKIPINQNDDAYIGELLQGINTKLHGAEKIGTSISIRTKDANAESGEVQIIDYKPGSGEGSGLLTFYESEFVKANQKEAKQVLQMFVDGLRDSSVSANTQQQVMTAIQESDNNVAAMLIPMIFDSSKADLFSAYKILNPFLGPLAVVLGIGSYLVIGVLVLSTVIDLLYIGLPVWREKVTENSKNASKPFGVSYEALTTVKEIEAGMMDNGSGYKNAYIIYFKRRALSYIILAVCILYLVAGQLSAIISFILSLGSGFLQ